MANPSPPFKRGEIDEAVRQARDYWDAPLTAEARAASYGFWLPFLLARIAELEASDIKARRIRRLEAENAKLRADLGALRSIRRKR